MKRTINPFRALALGYRYHSLYQTYAATHAQVTHLNGEVSSLTRLLERKMNACRSLERQKQSLLKRIAELEAASAG